MKKILKATLCASMMFGSVSAAALNINNTEVKAALNEFTIEPTKIEGVLKLTAINTYSEFNYDGLEIKYTVPKTNEKVTINKFFHETDDMHKSCKSHEFILDEKPVTELGEYKFSIKYFRLLEGTDKKAYSAATTVNYLEGIDFLDITSAKEVADGQVKLKWDADERVDYYEIYMQEPGSDKLAKFVTLSHNEKEYVVKGLSKGEYLFEVRAYSQALKKKFKSASKSIKVKNKDESKETYKDSLKEIFTMRETDEDGLFKIYVVNAETELSYDGIEITYTTPESGIKKTVNKLLETSDDLHESCSVHEFTLDEVRIKEVGSYSFKMKYFSYKEDGETKTYGKNAYTFAYTEYLDEVKVTSAKEVADGQVKLKWNADDRSDYYEVWMQTPTDKEMQKLVMLSHNTHEYTVKGLDKGKYTFEVRSYAKSLKKDYVSAYKNVTVKKKDKTDAVYTNDYKADFNIKESDEEGILEIHVVNTFKNYFFDGFEVSYTEPTTGEKVVVTKLFHETADSHKGCPVHIFKLDERKITKPDIYNITIKYFTFPVNGEGSNKYHGSTSVEYTKRLDGIKITSAKNEKNGQLKLKWKADSRTDYYEIWAQGPNDSSMKKFATVSNAENSYTLKDLKAYGTYKIQIRAYSKAIGTSVFEYDEKQVKVKYLEAPIKFTLKLAKKAGGEVKIEWQAAKHAQYYQVYRSTSKEGKYVRVRTTSSKTLKHTDKNLKKGTTYYYKIRTYEKVGDAKIYSKFSSIKSIKA